MKLKNLTELARFRFHNDVDLDCSDIKESLPSWADEYGFEYTCEDDVISTGGIFTGTDYDCVKIYHPEHEYDYYNYYITLEPQGKTYLAVIYSGGTSKQIGKEEFAKNTKIFDGSTSRGVAAGAVTGGALGAGFAIGSLAGGLLKGGIKAIAKGVNALTRNETALKEELEWYELATTIFSSMFSDGE